MEIVTITTDYMESHMYLVIESGHALVIDLGDPDLIVRTVEEKKASIDFCILTHEHCDHSLGSIAIRDKYKCRVYASSKCNEGLKSSRNNFSRYYNAFSEIQTKYEKHSKRFIEPFSADVDETFDGEMQIEWRGHSIYLRETPGHSQGSICILVDGNILFSGDSLLKDEATGTKFVGSSSEDLYKYTMPWFKTLPEDTIVYAGHGDRFLLKERMKEDL